MVKFAAAAAALAVTVPAAVAVSVAAPADTDLTPLDAFDDRFIACAWPCFKSIFALAITEECSKCMREKPRFLVLEAQLPFGYIVDMAQGKLGKGYVEMWCGVDDGPSGWIGSEEGGFTGCEVTNNFPGEDTTSHQDHAYVKREMATLPKLQDDGEVWRGNELGFIISNEDFWPNVNPRSVLLGSSVEQHKVLRPILMDLFSTCDADCKLRLRESVRQLMNQTTLAIQRDVKKWVFQSLFEIALPVAINPIDADEFVETQDSFTILTTLTQAVSDPINGIIEFFTKTRSTVDDYFERLLPLVREQYGVRLSESDCSPTDGGPGESCVRQLTSALLDTFLTAGGLSVPGAISTAMWVLYGNTAEANSQATSRDVFPVDYQLETGKESEFLYESMRIFAPVVGFPWWTTFPKRADDESALQTEGGVRKVLNLALANLDPNAWGQDAHKFQPKTMDEYHEKFVGFADFAVNNSVAEGKMNRKCPGKNLALTMGKIWLEEFEQDRWCTTDDSKYIKTTPFVEDFTLRVKESNQDRKCNTIN